MTHEELLPCPFCGTVPKLPHGYGSQYEIWCDDCGMAVSSVQICDLMSIDERMADPFTNNRYSEKYVERARNYTIKHWNTRVAPKIYVEEFTSIATETFPDAGGVRNIEPISIRPADDGAYIVRISNKR